MKSTTLACRKFTKKEDAFLNCFDPVNIFQSLLGGVLGYHLNQQGAAQNAVSNVFSLEISKEWHWETIIKDIITKHQKKNLKKNTHTKSGNFDNPFLVCLSPHAPR